MVNSEWVEREYVAIGSSFAAGPGVGRRVHDSPKSAGCSSANYAHLLASALSLKLTDVTSSGATTANVIDEAQYGRPPQSHALHESTDLVTITIGGNDLGYVGAVIAAALPRALRRLPWIAATRRAALDAGDLDTRLAQVRTRLNLVASQARKRAPHARIVFVDYLTLLAPQTDVGSSLDPGDVELILRLESGLEAATAQAAAASGCEVVAASAASRDHDPFSQIPWTTGRGMGFGRVPFHPNQAGMRAVADLLVTQLTS